MGSMKCRRLVIFGCGYVGRTLARAAVAAGWEVWIQSRNGDSLAVVNEVQAARRVVGDLHSRDWHAALPGKWDLAINLVSSAGGGLDGYRLSYIEGNQSILEWAGKAEVGRFIYTSATSVYPQTEGEWVAEEDVPAPASLSPSGQLLREAELIVMESEAVAEKIVVRLAGIYGPGRHLYLDRLQQGAASLPGDGSAWLNLIYLKDIVGALMQLASAPLPSAAEIFNLVDNEPARKQDIVDWLAAETETRPILFDPAEAGPRAARRTAQGKLPNRRVSNARLRSSLSWSPQFPDFRAGYRDILNG